MRLPSATAYMEALQDPSTCFADPELAEATPVLGPLGLPRAVSGNVATVFRLDSRSGASWAIRCFVRPVDHERLRYESLAAHLAGLQSTWRVGFELQPCGIRVDGEWWPMLKMVWAPGEPLLSYVERHLWDGPALAYLAERFAALAERLRADGVAHGDLQHGNILVAPGGDLRLVDYDGMYVPSLAGWGGMERGHRNYQHPGRDNGDFGPGLDHFSSWVIYASLAALSVDPLLWGRLDGGEETLLLRQHDLAAPDRSPALAALEASEGSGVRPLASMLRSFLAQDPADVPPLAREAVPALRQAGPRTGPSATSSAGIDPARRRSLYEALQGAPAGVGLPSSSPPSRARFAGDLLIERATLVVAAVMAAVIGFAAASTSLSFPAAAAVQVSLLAAAIGRLRHLYRRAPEVQAARRAALALAEPRKAMASATARVGQLSRQREQVASAEKAAAEKAEKAKGQLRGGEQLEARQVEDELHAALAVVERLARDSYRSEQETRCHELVALQRRVLKDQLGQHSLVAASARGVGGDFVHRLAMSGVRSAADFTGAAAEPSGVTVLRSDGRRLEVGGVDPQQAVAMMTWRRHVEEAVQLKLPAALPPERVAAIRADHDARRAALAQEAEAARRSARRQVAEIRSRWQEEHDRVMVELKALEAAAAQQRVELDRKLARARKEAAEAAWHLGEQEREVGHADAPGLGDYLRQVVGLGKGGGRRNGEHAGDL